MQIVACQHDIQWENPKANFGAVSRLLASTTIPAGSLIVLPEMLSTGYSMNVSLIVDQSGCVLAEAGESEECICHKPMLEKLIEWRSTFPALADRKPE